MHVFLSRAPTPPFFESARVVMVIVRKWGVVSFGGTLRPPRRAADIKLIGGPYGGERSKRREKRMRKKAREEKEERSGQASRERSKS